MDQEPIPSSKSTISFKPALTVLGVIFLGVVTCIGLWSRPDEPLVYVPLQSEQPINDRQVHVQPVVQNYAALVANEFAASKPLFIGSIVGLVYIVSVVIAIIFISSKPPEQRLVEDPEIIQDQGHHCEETQADAHTNMPTDPPKNHAKRSLGMVVGVAMTIVAGAILFAMAVYSAYQILHDKQTEAPKISDDAHVTPKPIMPTLEQPDTIDQFETEDFTFLYLTAPIKVWTLLMVIPKSIDFTFTSFKLTPLNDDDEFIRIPLQNKIANESTGFKLEVQFCCKLKRKMKFCLTKMFSDKEPESEIIEVDFKGGRDDQFDS